MIQLESAMGAAIGSIPGARALHVPRSRFAPVKTTDDLLACAPTPTSSPVTGR